MSNNGTSINPTGGWITISNNTFNTTNGGIHWTPSGNYVWNEFNPVKEDTRSIEEKISEAIKRAITVYDSHLEDGTIFMQVKGKDGKIYNLMLTLDEDK